MDLSESVDLLTELLPKVSAACRVRVASVSAGLTSSQRAALDLLDVVEPIGISDLARQLGVTPSTMSLNMDRLERKGLVQRQRSSADRRSVRVLLTSQGASLRNSRVELDSKQARSLLGSMSDEDRDHALYGLWLLGQAARALR